MNFFLVSAASLAASSASSVSVHFPSIRPSSIHLQDAERAAIRTVNVPLDQRSSIKVKNRIKLNAQ